MPSLPTDESVLDAMSRTELAAHVRAAQQFADAAYLTLHRFTVHVLMLPAGSAPDAIRDAAAAAGLVARCREVLGSIEDADVIMTAYAAALRRRGEGHPR